MQITGMYYSSIFTVTSLLIPSACPLLNCIITVAACAIQVPPSSCHVIRGFFHFPLPSCFQTAAGMPHEGNIETTFSLSGNLSSSNTHTLPEYNL